MDLDGMSRKEFSVAYASSSHPDDHSIDVDVLAPALLAFGKLIREANRETNGKASTAKVLVVSDFEHKCFNINFEVVLTLWEQARTLVGLEQVKDAKEILDWLGIFAAGATSVLTFFGFLRWKNGRKVTDVTEIKDADQTGMISVRIEGENNPVIINNHTLNLSNNPRALAAARDALSPVGTDNFDMMEIRDGLEIVGTIPKKDADKILSSCVEGIENSKDITPEIEVTTAWLTVYGPVYDANADNWRFRLGQEIIYADISATDIAQRALARGGALAEDTYQVKLEIETPKTAEGKPKKPHFRVLEVLRFIPGEQHDQPDLPLNDDGDERDPD